jgi:hypothetical protein
VRRDFVSLAAIALACAPAAACGLTADFSGIQGGTRDAGTRDAGGDVTTVADGGAGADGSGSGGDAGFCQSLTTPVHLCADFDEGASVGAGWSSTWVSQGQSISVDGTYYSPPGSFMSLISSNFSPATARLQEDMPNFGPSHVHMEFELLLPQLSGNLEICTLHEPVANGTTYGLYYKYQDGNLLVYVRTLADDGGEVDFTAPIGPPPAGWFHVEIDTDVSPSATIVVKHDGAVVVSQSNVNTSTDTRASMFVMLGYYSFNPADALAHFDNVIIDWQ